MTSAFDEDVAKCRICLNQDEDSENLYDEWSHQLTAAGKLYEELIGMQIGAAVQGPQYLCNSCGLQMRLFKKLKTKAYKTLETLLLRYGDEGEQQQKPQQQQLEASSSPVPEEEAEEESGLAVTLVEEKIAPVTTPLAQMKLEMKLEVQDEDEMEEEGFCDLLQLEEPEITAIEPMEPPPPLHTPMIEQKKFVKTFHEVQQEQIGSLLAPLPLQMSSSSEIELRKELDEVLDTKVNTAEHGYATIVYELLKDVNVEELDEVHAPSVVAASPPQTVTLPSPAAANLESLEEEEREEVPEPEEEDVTDDKSLYFDVDYLDDTIEEMAVDQGPPIAKSAKQHTNGENRKPMLSSSTRRGRRSISATDSGCQKKFRCSLCQWEFSTRKALADHKKADHSNKHPCPLCSKVMQNAETLRVHMNLHSGKAAYSCNQCEKTFKQKVHYQYHIDMHNNVRNFKCDVPTCGKAFITSTDLKTHKRFHSDARPYACDVCGKDFLLLQHMKMHRYSHGQKSLLCKICDQVFISPNTLRYHIKSIHNEEPRFECEFCNKKFRRKHHLHAHYKQHDKAKVAIPVVVDNSRVSTKKNGRLKEAIDEREEFVDDPLLELIDENSQIECISVYDEEAEDDESMAVAAVAAATTEGDQYVDDDNKVNFNYSDIIENDDDDANSTADVAGLRPFVF